MITDTVPLKRVARVRFSSVDKKSHEGELPVRLCNYSEVYYCDTITDDLAFMVATATPKELREFSLHRGDVLITKDSETPDDIGIPAYVSFSDDKVLCGYHLAQIRPDPDQLDARFLFWWMASGTMREELSSRANGITRFGLKLESIDAAPVRLPHMEEQRTIADFLDRETTRLDALVARRKAMLELLRERWATLISTTTQEGSAPQGTVPLKRMARVSYGLGQPPPTSLTGIAILRATNIHRGEIREEGMIFAELDDIPIARAPLLKAGEILVVRSGAYTGDSALITSRWEGSAPGYDLRLAPHPHTEPRFLAYQMLSPEVRRQIDIERSRAAQPHLNAEELGELRVWMPPLDRQAAIANRLDAERATFNNLASVQMRYLQLLSERRQALITSAVTGQVDMSAAA